MASPRTILSSDSDAAKMNRLRRGVAITAYLTGLLALSLHVFQNPPRRLAIDLKVYQAGAKALLHGAEIYSAHPPGSHLPFTYPPFAAILFTPMALLGPNIATLASIIANAAILLYCLRILLPLISQGAESRHRWVLIFSIGAAALFVEPVRLTFSFGQINLLLMGLVLADLLRHHRYLPKGLLIGVATAVKLTPGIFILYLFLTKQVRAALTATVTIASTIAIGFVIAPGSSVRYWTKLAFNPEHVGGIAYVGNQSINGIIVRLSGSPHDGRILWMILALMVAVPGLLLAAWIARDGDQLLGIGVCALTGLLVSPVSWSHHWVWVIPITVALWRRCSSQPPGSRLLAPLIGAWVCLFYLAPIWWVPNEQGREFKHHGMQIVAASSYVIAAVALLVTLAADQFRRYQKREDSVSPVVGGTRRTL